MVKKPRDVARRYVPRRAPNSSLYRHRPGTQYEPEETGKAIPDRHATDQTMVRRRDLPPALLVLMLMMTLMMVPSSLRVARGTIELGTVEHDVLDEVRRTDETYPTGDFRDDS